MKDVSMDLKKIFVDNNSLPIGLFNEPYFTDRLILFETLTGAYTKWKLFLIELMDFNDENEYLEVSSKVKKEVIDYIMNKEAFKELIDIDLNKMYPVSGYKTKYQDVYRPSNTGKKMLSIDLKSANFNALRYLNPQIVDNKNTYREFISGFTNLNSIITSKKIRQVIFGELSKKSGVDLEHIEMYIIQKFVSLVLECFLKEDVKALNKDEIVVDITAYDDDYIDSFLLSVKELSAVMDIQLEFEKYILRELVIIDKRNKKRQTGYYAKDFGFGSLELKRVPVNHYPMVVRCLLGQTPTESDLTFMKEGKLLKLQDDIRYKIKE